MYTDCKSFMFYDSQYNNHYESCLCNSISYSIGLQTCQTKCPILLLNLTTDGGDSEKIK